MRLVRGQLKGTMMYDLIEWNDDDTFSFITRGVSIETCIGELTDRGIAPFLTNTDYGYDVWPSVADIGGPPSHCIAETVRTLKTLVMA